MIPDATAVRAQLERILSSAAFTTAGRHSRLLRYLVERTVAGEGEQLKEYVLGTEVFDRADSYDPRIDSIVRVEARRLRTRLEDYYRTEGASDSILITIPRGTYVPVFAPRAVKPAPGNVADVEVRETAASSAKRRSYSPLAIIAAALSVAVALFAAGLALNSTRAPAQASSGPGVAVLPFEHYSTQQHDKLFAARLTDAVTVELAKLGTVSVVSRTSASRYNAETEPMGQIAKALNATFLIEASVVIRGGNVWAIARLVDARIDRKVWVGEYEMAGPEITPTARRIAAEAAQVALRTP